jgi:hypothetical protein
VTGWIELLLVTENDTRFRHTCHLVSTKRGNNTPRRSRKVRFYMLVPAQRRLGKQATHALKAPIPSEAFSQHSSIRQQQVRLGDTDSASCQKYLQENLRFDPLRGQSRCDILKYGRPSVHSPVLLASR